MRSLGFLKSGALPRGAARNRGSLMALRHAADDKGDVPIDSGDVLEHRIWTLEFVGAALLLLKAGAVAVDLKAVEEALGKASGRNIAPSPRRR